MLSTLIKILLKKNYSEESPSNPVASVIQFTLPTYNQCKFLIKQIIHFLELFYNL